MMVEAPVYPIARKKSLPPAKLKGQHLQHGQLGRTVPAWAAGRENVGVGAFAIGGGDPDAYGPNGSPATGWRQPARRPCLGWCRLSPRRPPRQRQSVLR